MVRKLQQIRSIHRVHEVKSRCSSPSGRKRKAVADQTKIRDIKQMNE